VNEKLQLNKALVTQKRGRPLLDYACRPERDSTASPQLGQNNVLKVQLVRLLLEYGSNPNQLIGENYKGHTVWSLFISDCYNKTTERQRLPNAPLKSAKDMWYEAVELMIDHGADPVFQIQVEVQKKVEADSETEVERETTLMSITTMLEQIFGADQAARLAVRRKEVAQRNHPLTSTFWRLIGWT
jgi:hypothetical protein